MLKLDLIFITANFVEVVHVELGYNNIYLTNKRGHIGMLEIFGQNDLLKGSQVMDLEGKDRII